MISTFFFLTSLVHAPLEEFPSYEEFSSLDPFYESFVGESMIGSTDLKDYLVEEDPKLSPELVDPEAMQLITQFVHPGSVVADYSSGYGGNALFLSHLIGGGGKLLAFSSEKSNLRALYWNLLRAKVHNATIFHAKKNLDSLAIQELGMIFIDLKGREQKVLEGAKETISRCKPVLVIHMLGGVRKMNADRFLKQEYEARLQKIRSMGYATEAVKDAWIIAIPE